jgi:DNA (cytosine-5)-methyltransferase 1
MIKLATAFSGGLAAPEFALRYEDVEHEVVFACEWDKYARLQYLEFHGEPKTFYNDISDLDARKYKDEVDLFIWGSPCQDLSLAGKRKGFDGEKSSLFREGARVMSEMMPKTFIFENVKGLLSSNDGRDYKEVVKTFQDMGYLIASKVLNAKEHGTAQNRERVFIVGFLDVDKYHEFNFAPHEKLDKVLRDYLEDGVDEKYYLSEKVINSMINPKYESMGIDRVNKEDDVCNCLTTMGGGNREPKVMVKSATNCGYEVATENDSINFTHPDSKTRRGRVGKGVAQTLDCSCNQGVMIGAIRGRNPDNPKSRTAGLPTQQMLEINESGTSNCLTSVQKDNVVIENKEAFRIRRLTPRECFRLQGINDKDINLINSDTQSYKIAGNAIEVNTMRSIIRQLYNPIPSGGLF